MLRLKIMLIGVLVALVAAFGSLALASPATALSCAPGTYSVSVNVNVRVGASTSARILTTLAPGSTVEVVGEKAGSLVGNSSLWCEVSVNGATGYVHSGALTPGGSNSASGNDSAGAPPAEITGSTIYHVVGNRINARSAPNTSATVVTQIPANTDVVVTGQAEGTRVSGSTVWYLVTYNGQSMYVHSSLLAIGSVAPPPPAEQPNTPPTVDTNVQSPVQQPSNDSFVCPRNCAGAVAMGLTPQQAATCPRLDRDGDGVACYGD